MPVEPPTSSPSPPTRRLTEGSVLQSRLSEPAAELYERLVIDGSLLLDESRPWQHDPVIVELIEAGFAWASWVAPRALVPVAPAIVCERLVPRLHDIGTSRQREVLALHELAGRLQSRFQSNRWLRIGDTARVLSGQHEAGITAGQVLQSARSIVRAWDTGPYHTDYLDDISPMLPMSEDQHGANVILRCVYDDTRTGDPSGRAVIEESIGEGEEARTVPHLPMKMIIADEHTAVVALGPYGHPALLVRSPHLVRFFGALYEAVWERATPWKGWTPEHARSRARPAGVRRPILELMASGHKDEAIARGLGLSVRTVRRHIADMMRELGAPNRFAAGVAAVRAQWLPDDVEADRPRG